jgi:hypothetical protein
MEVLAVGWLVPRDVERCAEFSTEEPTDLDPLSSDSNCSVTYELGPQQIWLPFMMSAGVGEVAKHFGTGTLDNDRSRSNRHGQIVPWSIEKFTQYGHLAVDRDAHRSGVGGAGCC